MKADMLASQFEALEEPSDALIVDVSPPPDAIVEQILTELRRPPHTHLPRAATPQTGGACNALPSSRERSPSNSPIGVNRRSWRRTTSSSKWCAWASAA